MQLRPLAQLIFTRRRAVACEACGGPFTCGAKLTGCWCSAIKVSEETRAELKSRYRDCLCRNCLEKFSAATDQPRSEELRLTVDNAD